MSDQQKEYFRHTQLVAEVRRHLKTAAIRDRFIEGLERYGLEGIEPNFEDSPELKTAFAKVRPEMAKGWAASQAAGFSNAVQASKPHPEKKGKAKANPKAPAPSAQDGEGAKLPPLVPVGDRPTFPAHKAPAPEVVEALRLQGFAVILSAPEPPSGEELRALFDWLGPEVASCLLWYIEKRAKAYGPAEFWKAGGPNVVQICVEKYNLCAAAFEKFFAAAAPQLHEMARPLTFANYQRLRCRYGRANVCAKICQQREQKNFNFRVDGAAVLENYIRRSIAAGKDSKFGLPSFDDEGRDLGENNISFGGLGWAGYDDKFNLPPSPLVKLDF